MLVVGLQAPLSFLNASTFHADLLQRLQTNRAAAPRARNGLIPEIDFTAAQLLLDIFSECHEQGIKVAVARLESLRAQAAFERFALYSALPRDHVFHSVDQAIRALAAK